MTKPVVLIDYQWIMLYEVFGKTYNDGHDQGGGCKKIVDHD